MNLGLVIEKSPVSEVLAVWAVLIALFIWATLHHRRQKATPPPAKKPTEAEPQLSRDALTTEGYDFAAMIGSESIAPSALRIYDVLALPHSKRSIERSFMNAIRDENRFGNREWIPVYELMLHLLSFFQPGVGSSPLGCGNCVSKNREEIKGLASVAGLGTLSSYQKQRIDSMLSEVASSLIDHERSGLIRSDQERYSAFMASELGEYWTQHMRNVEGVAERILSERRIADTTGTSSDAQ